LANLAGGVPLSALIAGLLRSIDPGANVEQARTKHGLGPEEEPPAEQVIDEVTPDQLLSAGFGEQALEKARALATILEELNERLAA
jgi:hypothetical protein